MTQNRTFTRTTGDEVLIRRRGMRKMSGVTGRIWVLNQKRVPPGNLQRGHSGVEDAEEVEAGVENES